MDKIEQILSTNGIVQFLFLVLVTAFGCAKVTVQGRCCRKYIRNSQDSVLYNVMFFASVAAALAIALPLSSVTTSIVVWAAIHSFSYAAFQILYSVALTCGPVSLTVLIINFSSLISTAFSVIALNEKLFLTQVIGIIFLITSMILSCNKTAGEKKATKKWVILTVTCLLTNGVGACIQMMFSRSETVKNIPNSDNTYLVVLYIFSAIVSLFVYLIVANTGKKEKSTFWFSKNVLFYAMAVGVIIGIFQKGYMMGNKTIPGTFMFPTYYGLQSLGMSLIGIILFKDRLSIRQKIGIVFGVCCIAMMNVKVGISFSF